MSIKYLRIKVAFLCLVTLGSCNKWIDVSPKDKLTQKVIFSTKEGYLKALNGIYSELNAPGSYGRDLTMGMLDAMAQYYKMGDAEHNLLPYVKFDYASENFKSKLNSIWAKHYNLIANTNAILDQVDNNNGILPKVYHGMVKGETLAMRAFLHFDLLRLYGPIFSINKAKECMPYIESSDRSVQPLLSAEAVLQKVIKDLTDAQILLQDADPVLTQGPLNIAGEINNHMNYRQYKLNYFAVTALLARVHLWAGDKVSALSYAKEVIAKGQVAGNEFFPFVTMEEIRPTTQTSVPDRVFSKEILFAGYNQKREASFNALFSPTLNATSILTFPGSLTDGRVATLYDNQNDYRRSMWITRTVSDNEVVFFNKYEDVSDPEGKSNAFRYMLPLIRMSEMYLIVAECAPAVQEAGDALNQLRLHRGIHPLDFNTMDEIDRIIENEFIKEFLGEGQLFYFFKRKAYTFLPDGNKVAGGEIPMQLEDYIFPLPESETSQRVN